MFFVTFLLFARSFLQLLSRCGLFMPVFLFRIVVFFCNFAPVFLQSSYERRIYDKIAGWCRA